MAPAAAAGAPPTAQAVLEAADAERAGRPGADAVSSDTEPDCDAAPAGAGWTGSGPPLMVGTGTKRRGICDGAGLCSPGRWPPHLRRLPHGGATGVLRDAMLGKLRQLDAQLLLAKLACNKCEESPFPVESTAELRQTVLGYLRSRGHFPDPREGDQPQVIGVRLIGALLTDAGDPDAKVMDTFAQGVRLGIGVRLPRTPAVYGPKKRWKYASQKDPHAAGLCDDPDGVWQLNYKSADVLAPQVLALLRQQAARAVPQVLELSYAEAEARYGDRLVVASLGALAKKTDPDGTVSEVRILHDGTNKVPGNDRIKVRDQEKTPCAPDIKRQLRAQSRYGTKAFGLTADVKEAHRIVAEPPC